MRLGFPWRGPGMCRPMKTQSIRPAGTSWGGGAPPRPVGLAQLRGHPTAYSRVRASWRRATHGATGLGSQCLWAGASAWASSSGSPARQQTQAPRSQARLHTRTPGSMQAPSSHARLHAGSELTRQAPCRLRACTPGSMQALRSHVRLHAGSVLTPGSTLTRQAPCRLHTHTPGSMQAPCSHARLNGYTLSSVHTL